MPAPIASVAELAAEMAERLRDPFDPVGMERLLAAVVLFAHTNRAGMTDALTPLAGTASAPLDILMQAITAAEIRPQTDAPRTPPDYRGRRETPHHPQGPPTHHLPAPHRMLVGRIREIAEQLAAGCLAPSLLATPSTVDGHVSPARVLLLLARAERDGWQPGPHDLAQALLRMPRRVDRSVAEAAARLTSAAGRRFAAWLQDGGLPDPAFRVVTSAADPAHRTVAPSRHPAGHPSRPGTPPCAPDLTGLAIPDGLLEPQPSRSTGTTSRTPSSSTAHAPGGTTAKPTGAATAKPTGAATVEPAGATHGGHAVERLAATAAGWSDTASAIGRPAMTAIGMSPTRSAGAPAASPARTASASRTPVPGLSTAPAATASATRTPTPPTTDSSGITSASRIPASSPATGPTGTASGTRTPAPEPTTGPTASRSGTSVPALSSTTGPTGNPSATRTPASNPTTGSAASRSGTRAPALSPASATRTLASRASGVPATGPAGTLSTSRTPTSGTAGIPATTQAGATSTTRTSRSGAAGVSGPTTMTGRAGDPGNAGVAGVRPRAARWPAGSIDRQVDDTPDMRCWPMVLPGHREIVAAHCLPFLSAAGGSGFEIVRDLARSSGPFGPAMALVVAHGLVSVREPDRVAAVDAVVHLAGADGLDAALLGRELKVLVAQDVHDGGGAHLATPRATQHPPGSGAARLAASLSAVGRAGHWHVVWTLARATVPALLRLPTPPDGLPALLATAGTAAASTGARGDIPEVTAAARAVGTPIGDEAARLAGIIG